METTTAPQSFNFTCSAEWHLVRLGSKYAAPIYSLSLRLSKGSGRFFPAINSIAEYFDAHPRYIGKAFRLLEKAQFFEVLKREKGSPVSYRPIFHQEWQKTHPGRCLEKVAMPWSGEGVDALVSRLHAASDGKLKLYANFVRGLRNTGHSDDAIVAAFAEFHSADSGAQLGRYARFMEYLRGVEPTEA